MSKLGALRCPRIADKRGMVVGGGRNPSTIRVLFDGNKSSTMLHQAYVEPIGATEEIQETT